MSKKIMPSITFKSEKPPVITYFGQIYKERKKKTKSRVAESRMNKKILEVSKKVRTMLNNYQLDTWVKNDIACHVINIMYKTFFKKTKK